MKHRIKCGFNYLEQSPMFYAHSVCYFKASFRKTTTWSDRNIIKTYSEQYSSREWQRLRRVVIVMLDTSTRESRTHFVNSQARRDATLEVNQHGFRDVQGMTCELGRPCLSALSDDWMAVLIHNPLK